MIIDRWKLVTPAQTLNEQQNHPSLVGPGAFIKRLMDITGALAGLLFLFPLMMLVALFIRLESKGPALFLQRRVGINGKEFTMFKFRSMRCDAEANLHMLSHLNEIQDGPIFKIKHDPRVTRMGQLIRRTSIDELPQLFNVLFGQMSLVGPRPPLPSEVAQYQPLHWQRLAVKPGLSGLWQCSGRSDLGSFLQMLNLDLAYIRDWSLTMDIKIILKTIRVVLCGTGSYAFLVWIQPLLVVA